MPRKKPAKPLRKLGMKDITVFKIANRKGFAAVAKKNLTEGRTVFQAYDRLVKACKRNGFELPQKTAKQLPTGR
jgi:hypothetical protein